jgi:hypothetical protein
MKKKFKIYVASSWRNEQQKDVVTALRCEGHEVYDFKNPTPNTGFSWAEIDHDWQQWNNEQYLEALNYPIANRGFKSDFDAMKWADICVLVMPCGRSAHVEAGWMQGASKPTIVLLSQAEPELMYKIFENIVTDIADLLNVLTIWGESEIYEAH